jgi:hypothetical protein
MYKKSLDFLSDHHKAELNRYFMAASTKTMPHQIAVRLGIEYTHALALLADMETEGLCDMRLLIYHICEPDIPVGTLPYGTGFPNLPWTCPNCGSVVEDYHELSFDLMAISKQPIEFI